MYDIMIHLAFSLPWRVSSTHIFVNEVIGTGGEYGEADILIREQSSERQQVTEQPSGPSLHNGNTSV